MAVEATDLLIAGGGELVEAHFTEFDIKPRDWLAQVLGRAVIAEASDEVKTAYAYWRAYALIGRQLSFRPERQRQFTATDAERDKSRPSDFFRVAAAWRRRYLHLTGKSRGPVLTEWGYE